MVEDVRSRRRQQTRDEILDAAWELARRDGIAAISLRELAANVGMRAPSLYTYFASKNDLYDAMYARGMQEFAMELEQATGGRTPLVALQRRATTFVRVAAADSLRYELLFQRPVPGFAPSQPSLDFALRHFATTREIARAAGLRSQEAFDLFVATTRGLVEMQISNEPGGDRWVKLVPRAVAMMVADAERSRRR
jgi:AcrR family transcriptional regulator